MLSASLRLVDDCVHFSLCWNLKAHFLDYSCGAKWCATTWVTEYWYRYLNHVTNTEYMVRYICCCKRRNNWTTVAQHIHRGTYIVVRRQDCMRRFQRYNSRYNGYHSWMLCYLVYQYVYNIVLRWREKSKYAYTSCCTASSSCHVD